MAKNRLREIAVRKKATSAVRKNLSNSFGRFSAVASIRNNFWSLLNRVRVTFGGDSDADPYRSIRSYTGALLNRPIFDRASMSYFELIEIKEGVPYHRAMRVARKKTFKGVPGRLAIIRFPATQRLLDRWLRPDDESWIGLRYFCNRRDLLWSDGRLLRPDKDYLNWGPDWHYADGPSPCKPGEKFAGVVLAPISKAGYSGEGTGWFAVSSRCAVSYLIIEYPTGRQFSPEEPHYLQIGGTKHG